MLVAWASALVFGALAPSGSRPGTRRARCRSPRRSRSWRTTRPAITSRPRRSVTPRPPPTSRGCARCSTTASTASPTTASCSSYHVFDILTTLAPRFESAVRLRGVRAGAGGAGLRRARSSSCSRVSRPTRAAAGSPSRLGFLYYVQARTAATWRTPPSTSNWPPGCRARPRAAREFAAFARQNSGGLAVAYRLWEQSPRDHGQSLPAGDRRTGDGPNPAGPGHGPARRRPVHRLTTPGRGREASPVSRGAGLSMQATGKNALQIASRTGRCMFRQVEWGPGDPAHPVADGCAGSRCRRASPATTRTAFTE